MRWEQCCESQGCMRPSHFGTLCAACFLAAAPARRAVELLVLEPAPDRIPSRVEDYVGCEGAAWLEQLWAA